MERNNRTIMASFDDLGLSPKALAAVASLGYEEPTPVQERAIPLVLEGHDIIAAAKTGTGKTAAFSLPSMDKLGHAKGERGPLMLVVTPTRELAAQIAEVCEAVAKSTHHRVLSVVGGVSYNPQISALKRGTDVLIATPGRLIDLMEQKAAYLDRVEVLVLDEPAAGLDPRGREEILGGLMEYQKQRQSTMLIISHSMEDIAKYADSILVLKNGKIFLFGTVGEVFADAQKLFDSSLDLPQITKLFVELQKRGLADRTDVYTVGYAVKTAAKLAENAAKEL